MTTPDQATGMNELRELIEQLTEQTSLHMMNMTMAPELTADLVKNAEDRAVEAVQQLVERCLLEIENHHPTCRSVINIDDDYCDCGTLSHNLAVGRIRHNLQQAGLLRGDEA